MTIAPVLTLVDDGFDAERIITERTWPVLDEAAFHGLAGDIVRELAPGTEADPAAMLATLLALFGWLVGSDDPNGHLLIANERHAPIVWPVIVGTTSAGAKGTSYSAIWRIFQRLQSELAARGLDAVPHRSGLSSGEGLIEAVRDASGDEDAKDFDPGIQDKRLLIKETELGAVLGRLHREGNTLGPVLRQAWDGGDLSVMTKKPIRATRPHVVIVGHISPDELRDMTRSNDFAGGTLNRFAFVCSRRSQRLPEGGNADAQQVERFAKILTLRMADARVAGQLVLTPAAALRWRGTYGRLTAERPDTKLTRATGRRAPQVLRLALLYALLNGHPGIEEADLQAAEALEQYSVDSAEYVFGGLSDKDADELAKLHDFIREGGARGRTKNEIRELLYKKHVEAAVIRERLALLLEYGAITETVREVSAGRRPTVYIAR